MTTKNKQIVTKWRHHSWDMALILPGLPTETREEAEKYALPDAQGLTFEVAEMSGAEVAALPEFDG